MYCGYFNIHYPSLINGLFAVQKIGFSDIKHLIPEILKYDAQLWKELPSNHLIGEFAIIVSSICNGCDDRTGPLACLYLSSVM